MMLLHLPTDHTAEAVRDALTKTVLTSPAHLRRSLTWDQGCESPDYLAAYCHAKWPLSWTILTPGEPPLDCLCRSSP